MKRKVLLSIIVGGLFLAIIAVIIIAFRFSLFGSEIEEVAIIDISGKDNKIGIYYIPSNATSQDYIQIRKLGEGQDEIIKNFERFDFVVNSELIDDSLLRVVLKDTSAYIVNQDTFIVNIK